VFDASFRFVITYNLFAAIALRYGHNPGLNDSGMVIIRVLLIELQKAQSQRTLILLGGDKASQSRNPTVSLLQGYRGGGVCFFFFPFFFGRETLKSQVTHGQDVKSFL